MELFLFEWDYLLNSKNVDCELSTIWWMESEVDCELSTIWWTESEVDCELFTMWWKWSLWHWYNLRQDIVDKFTKLSKIGFSIKCFITDFWHNFLAHLSKYALWVAGWVLAINSRDFAKVS